MLRSQCDLDQQIPLTLAQAMARVDRANFVLKKSQAYDDSPQCVVSLSLISFCPMS